MNDIDRERAAENLKIVRTIMESCSRRQQDDGIHFIIWGLLIPVATGFNYLLVYLEKWKSIGLLWGTVALVGIVLSIVVSVRRRGARAETHGGRVQAAVWIACWITMMLIMAAGFITGGMKLNFMMMLIAFIMANAVFISGFLSGTRMLKLLAAGWWATGIVCAFTHEYTASIIVALATFLLSFIPGVILDRRYKAASVKM
ncbi:MAG: hypothetical protein JEZ04_15340 [Spirochaetales bacterium]|nr:hypothetical protein [Spirochaetales bacterium]